MASFFGIKLKGFRFVVNISECLPRGVPKDSGLADRSTLVDLEGEKLRITGPIELYKGKPESKIMSKEQLSLEQ